MSNITDMMRYGKFLGGGVSSWNDLTDKPFGVEQAFEPIVFPDMWDKSDGYDLGPLLGGDSLMFYKVNTSVPAEGTYAGADIHFPTIPRTHMKSIYLIDTGLTEAELYGINAWSEDDIGDGSYESKSLVFFFLLIVRSENDYGIPVGVYIGDGKYDDGVTYPNGFMTIFKEITVPIDEKYLPESVDSVVIRSSTEGSGKKFKLTVDDSGTISATEAIE